MAIRGFDSLDAQVPLLQGMVVSKRRRRRLVHDLAPLHDIDTIGDFEGQRQVLLGDQDCKPHLVPQPGDEVAQDPYDLRRQSFRRLVQQPRAGNSE